MQQPVHPQTAHGNGDDIIQIIVFLAGNEEFGVPIDDVREIIKISMITPIPNSPDYIKGIVNVRGEIVTAIDVKLRFMLPQQIDSEAKHIIVSKQEDNLFGLIVDEVIEVLRIQKSEISPPPTLVTQIHKKYISGVISHGNRLIIVLNLASMLAQKELMDFVAGKSKHTLAKKTAEEISGEAVLAGVSKKRRRTKTPNNSVK